jgi:hypothetical protein
MMTDELKTKVFSAVRDILGPSFIRESPSAYPSIFEDEKYSICITIVGGISIATLTVLRDQVEAKEIHVHPSHNDQCVRLDFRF